MSNYPYGVTDDDPYFDVPSAEDNEDGICDDIDAVISGPFEMLQQKRREAMKIVEAAQREVDAVDAEIEAYFDAQDARKDVA